MSRRRVRIELDGGYMHVCLTDGASDETIAALKDLGQAAVTRMQERAEPDAPDYASGECGDYSPEPRP